MVTERFLGGAWASVHGPSDPREFLVWVLDQGFRGLGLGPGPRAVPWRQLQRALGDLPVDLAAVRVGGVLELPAAGEGNLASTHAGDREAALARVRDAVGLARHLGCARVVLDAGVVRVTEEHGPDDIGDSAWTPEQAAIELTRRNASIDSALDVLCRSLFELCREFQDMEFCLTVSRHVRGLGDPMGLAHVFEDLAGTKLSYWHDVALAARRQELFGTGQGEWLDAFSNRMVGMTLGDSQGGELYLPPGAGGVDYPLVGSYRRRSGYPIPAVIELDPAVEPCEVPGVHAFLGKYGL